MINLKISRWVRLALAVLALLFAGVIYAWSAISTPFAEFGWAGAPLKMTYTLCLIFFCLGGLVSGLLSKKLSLFVRMLISAALLALGFVLTSALDGKNIFLLYLTYGVMAGAGVGVAYNCVISATAAWFPDKKGVCNGVMMMAFGFSALIIGKVATALFDPAALGWRQTYVLLGCASGAVLAVLALILRLPAKEDNLPAAPKRASAGGEDIPSGEMVKRASFYKLFVFFFLLASVGSTAIGSTREIIVSFSEDPAGAASLAVSMVGIVAIMNGIGRLISGAVYDALGLRKAQYVASAVGIAAPALTLIAVLTRSLPLGLAGLCLCGVSYGFCPTLTSAFVSGFYGQKYFSLNFSVTNLVLIPAAFISTLTAFLNTQTGSLVASFALLTAFSVVGLFVNLSIKKA